MVEIIGKYGTAKVYVTDDAHLDNETRKQILALMNSKAVEGAEVRIMPDTHAGAGATIGTTIKLNGRVIPSAVGVDISCGMLVAKFYGNKVNEIFGHTEGLKRLDNAFHRLVPMGMNHRKTLHRFSENVHLDKVYAPINAEKLLYSIGTLGGGNHFAELNKDSNGDYYFVIHSGSRHLGLEIANFYTKKAKNKDNTEAKDALIKKLKSEHREKEIQAELEKLSKAEDPSKSEIPYIEGELLDLYLNDMKWAQEYAYWNREAMLNDIINEFNLKKALVDKFTTIHNYIDVENKILRKGAISLQKDEVAIIPGTMAFGSLIVKGKGNPDWNFSGPHGAGRLMSRSKAKETLKMEDFKKSMEGIYTTSVSVATLDESPMAYKPMEEIINNIQDTCEIIERIVPVWNCKAGGEE